MLSFELKIPKSKLKNLYYEMRLRYSSDEEINISKSAAEIIKRTLSRGLYEISKEGLKLMIANPYDRHILEAFFRNNGMTYDYSFSKDILKLTPEKFKNLIEKMIENERLEEWVLDELEKRYKIPKSTGLNKLIDWFKDPGNWSIIIEAAISILEKI